LEQRFDATNLMSLRSAVAAHGSALGLSAARVDDLVLVAHELASNAVRHGGGGGRLRVWRVDGSVYCEVADTGGGFLYAPPDRLPAVSATGGRGLWIIAHLADDLWVESNEAGTTTRIELRV
jgi:anti-sigma regulatory factor (Ser/Thr protein kinase)